MTSLNKEPLISISEASHILGVSEAALRQWTDDGLVKAFITPGGHRRYSTDELKRIMASHQKLPGIKQLVTGLEDTADKHRELDRNRLQAMPWFAGLDKKDQAALAQEGRHILDLVKQYVSQPGRRPEILVEAREAGARLGEKLAGLGLPLTDAVEVFIMHRDPLMKAATNLKKHKEPLSERVVGAIPLVALVIDEALVGLVSAHQQYQVGKQEKI